MAKSNVCDLVFVFITFGLVIWNGTPNDMFLLACEFLLFGSLLIALMGPVVIDPESSPLDRIWKR